MKPTIALLSGIALASTQVVYRPTIVTTVGSPHIKQDRFNESDISDLARPNATKSVNFTAGGQGWTWRVNITDFSVPDASIGDEPAPDARIILSTYGLQWSSPNETLSEIANRLNKQSSHASSQSTHGPKTSGNASEIEDPICMSVLDDAIVLPNVTDKYESGSSCEAVFGQECLHAIVMDSTYSDAFCSSPSLNIPQCQGVFDGSGSYSQTAMSISGKENDTHSGDGLYYQYGFASKQSNTTALRQAESQLRMMVLTLPNNVKEAVCIRVDSTINDMEVSDIAQRPGWNDTGSSDQDSSPSGDDESAASAQVAGTTVSIGLVVAAISWFGSL